MVNMCFVILFIFFIVFCFFFFSSRRRHTRSGRVTGVQTCALPIWVAKTLYLLKYIDDEAYRRRILTQLNRGEGRHSLIRTVCHGNKGEIRKRFREGQEDQLNALGLVTNALILWNTFYMDRALNHLRQQGITVNPDDVARLSPLGHIHFNMLGRYYFELAEALKKGGFRPLRNPNDPDEQFY